MINVDYDYVAIDFRGFGRLSSNTSGCSLANPASAMKVRLNPVGNCYYKHKLLKFKLFQSDKNALGVYSLCML